MAPSSVGRQRIARAILGWALLWPGAACSTVADRDVALLIAIGAYDGPRADAVRFAERDAAAVGRVLRTRVGVSPDRVFTVIHRPSAPITAERIEQAVDDAGRLLADGPGARLWLYITGHGVMRAERQAPGHPAELRHRLVLPHAPVEVRDWPSASIDLDALLDRIDGLPVAHTLAMIDICRRIVPGHGALGAADRRVRPRDRTTVWWAAQPGEEAFSRHTPPGAVFTGAVLATLDVDRPDPLTLRGAHRAVRGRLKRFSRAHGPFGGQWPQLVPAASITPETWVIDGRARRSLSGAGGRRPVRRPPRRATR